MSANAGIHSLTIEQFKEQYSQEQVDHLFDECGSTYNAHENGVTVLMAVGEDGEITEVIAAEMPAHLAKEVSGKGYPCAVEPLLVMMENDAMPDHPAFALWEETTRKVISSGGREIKLVVSVEFVEETPPRLGIPFLSRFFGRGRLN